MLIHLVGKTRLMGGICPPGHPLATPKAIAMYFLRSPAIFNLAGASSGSDIFPWNKRIFTVLALCNDLCCPFSVSYLDKILLASFSSLTSNLSRLLIVWGPIILSLINWQYEETGSESLFCRILFSSHWKIRSSLSGATSPDSSQRMLCTCDLSPA